MRAGEDHFKNEQGDAHLKEEQAIDKPVIPDYTYYPRSFITYRWYRPVITGILFVVLYYALGIGLVFAALAVNGGDIMSALEGFAGGYDNMDVYTPLGAFVSLGSVAVMIPALALANLIAGKRTFRSYSSSRGGWDFGIFFKSLALAFLVCSVPIVIDNIFHYGRMNANRFTIAGFILLTILGPLQCIAEEYGFRGILLQTVGSWIRFAPLAIVVSSLVFALMHPYNTLGVINIFVDGCCFAFVAWITRGLEASSAYHIANNMAIFYTTGFGFGKITSEITVGDAMLSIAIDIVFAIVMIVCRKRGMFDKVRRNDADEYNAKVEAKLAAKQAKKAARQS